MIALVHHVPKKNAVPIASNDMTPTEGVVHLKLLI